MVPLAVPEMVPRLGQRIRRPVLTPVPPACSSSTATSTTWFARMNRSRARTARCPDFLATQLFGNWDIVLIHDLSYGLRMAAGTNRERLRKMFGPVSERIGEPKTWPKDPDAILALLDQLFQKNVMEDNPGATSQRGRDLRSCPVSDAHFRAQPDGRPPGISRLVRLLSWAQSPYIKRSNIAICLLCDRLSELNERLVGSPHVAAIEISMPDAPARQAFVSMVRRPGRPPRQPDQLHSAAARRPHQRPEPGQPGATAGTSREIRDQARRQQPEGPQEGTDRTASAGARRVRRAAPHPRRLRGQRRAFASG